MQALDILQLATRVFKTNFLRTALTILGIGVGIGTILFLVSLGFGLQRLILEQITTSEALLTLDVLPEGSAIIELNEENMKKIKSLPNVEKVSPVISIPAQIEINGLGSDINVNAVDASKSELKDGLKDLSFFKLSGVETKAGKFFVKGEANKIVISTAILKTFNIQDPNEAIGSIAKIKLYLPKKSEMEAESVEEIEEISLPIDFEIVGVVDDDSTAYAYISMSELNETGKYQIEAMSNLALPNFSRVKVKVSSQDKVNETREKLIAMGLSASSLSDTIDEANKIFQAIQIILSLFGAVALIVSAIGMFNTMTIALLERTQEIGIMKSLGASRSDIWMMFLVESVLIGFFGGLSGITMGVAAALISNLGVNKLASSLGGMEVNLFYAPKEFLIAILVFSTVVGFMTGLYPARRASRLNPLDALRYK